MRENVAIAAAALFLGAVSAALAVYKAEAKRQPIAYNHKKHIDAGLDCGTCHTGIAEGSAAARIPGIDICLGCHESDDNPKTQAIRDYAAKKEPIPWERVYSVPENVYFPHQRHVGGAKLDCAVCHGDMKVQEAPVARQAVRISMGRCMGCHKRSGASNNCLACHR